MSTTRIFLPLLLIVSLAACNNTYCPVCDGYGERPPPGVHQGSSEFPCGDTFDDQAIDRLAQTVTAEGAADILLISGGGSRGSFGAGAIYSWPNQPRWDMVTGISTGSIMATWAYLGKDHPTKPFEAMEYVYGGHITAKQIRKRRWLFPLVDSKYTLQPLRKLFQTTISQEMIIEVGREYRKTGRQLWIGTTNLETGQFCSWNLGVRGERALMAQERGDVEALKTEVDMYHTLILASSANPTVFEAVDVYGYTHVDGGVSETIYVERLDEIAARVVEVRESNRHKPLNVYAIVNGRLISSQRCVGANFYDLATRSISLLGKSATRGNLDRIKNIVDEGLQGRPWNYYTGWIPSPIPLDPADVFNEKEMRMLFIYGGEWISDQESRWCPGIPAATHGHPNCDLPAAGIPKC